MYQIAFWQCLSPFLSSFTSCKRRRESTKHCNNSCFQPFRCTLICSSLYDIQLAVQVCFENSLVSKSPECCVVIWAVFLLFLVQICRYWLPRLTIFFCQLSLCLTPWYEKSVQCWHFFKSVQTTSTPQVASSTKTTLQMGLCQAETMFQWVPIHEGKSSKRCHPLMSVAPPN